MRLDGIEQRTMNINLDLVSMAPLREKLASAFAAIGQRQKLKLGVGPCLKETKADSVANLSCSQRTFEFIRTNQDVHDDINGV